MEIGGVLVFEGANFFRQRLTLATLSGKSVRIKGIRVKGGQPGLTEYEANFIRLLDRLCNGSHIEVNETGTSILYKPGVLTGGRIEHICSNKRGIGYYLEPLFMLAPFCKVPVDATLTGVTNNKLDPSVDMIRYSMVPVLKNFLVIDEGFKFSLDKRGLPPLGEGVVTFKCPVRRSLKSFQIYRERRWELLGTVLGANEDTALWTESGKVKRIRGVTYSCRVAPIVSNRMLDAAKKVFANYLTDVYFTVDNSKGKSPGFGMCVVAETNKGTVLSAESMSNSPKEDKEIKLPEDVGQEAAWRLLEEIYRGGCVDSTCQPLLLLFMVLTGKDVSKIVLGPLTPYSMNLLRHLRDFFQVTFKIDEHQDNSVKFSEDNKADDELKLGSQKLLLTCVGAGFTNFSKGQI